MEKQDKVRLKTLLAFGRRDEALSWIRDNYRVNEEEAGRLLQAIEAEPLTASIGPSQFLRWGGMAVFILGLVFVAIGAMRYFVFASNDERQLDRISGTVQDIRELDDGLEITIVYEYHGSVYANTERNEVFRELGLRKGQVLEMVVNASNPKDAALLVLEPYIKASGLRYGGMGVLLILASIVLWRIHIANSAHRP